MALKQWLQKNGAFDKDLLVLFPKYGVNDPEKELKNLKPAQWKEIQETIKTNRAKELKDNAAKLRLQKKLTKIEKLWKAKRPKKKVKEPKLLKLFDDAEPAKEQSNGTSSPKRKKGSKSPKKKKNGSKPSSPKKTKDKDKKKDKDAKSTKSKDKDSESSSKDAQDSNNSKNTDNNNKETASNTKEESNGAKATKSDETEKKEKEADENWDQYDNLKLSDNEEEPKENGGSYTIPTLGKQESVVDALMAGPYGPGDKTEESKDKEDGDKDKEDDKGKDEEEEEAIDFTSTNLEEREKSDATMNAPSSISHSVSTAAVIGDEETWDRYDDLRLSDEENEEEENKENKEDEKTKSAPGLYVPLFPLKTQGSVVDMLMDGPRTKPSPKSAFISVTPPAPEDDAIPSPPEDGIKKDYSITVSHGSKTEIKVDGKAGKDAKQENDPKAAAEVNQKLNKIMDKLESKDDDNTDKKSITLSADAFVYNENTNSYTISLSSARLLRSDFIKGMITFEISGKRINKDKSDSADKQMDDKYIDSVLDEIERDNPDSDQD